MRERLAARRRTRGITQEELAQLLRVTTSTVAGWEQGRSTPRARHRRPLAEHLDVTLAELEIMINPNGAAAPDGHDVPEWLGHFASLEQGAGEICDFQSFTVHALLQTRPYATAVESVGPNLVTDDEVARKVETRLARQRVLDRQPDPLKLFAVLDESVLYRVTGGREVMADQLDHLVRMAKRPNVDLRVLPLDAGVHAAAFGAFTLFTRRGSSTPFMAVVEDRAGPHYRDEPYEVVEAHTTLFNYLLAVALPPAETIDLIRRVAKEHYR